VNSEIPLDLTDGSGGGEGGNAFWFGRQERERLKDDLAAVRRVDAGAAVSSLSYPE
jgi:hypothetical protein